jgi:hypothetical protein
MFFLPDSITSLGVKHQEEENVGGIKVVREGGKEEKARREIKDKSTAVLNQQVELTSTFLL